jgi:TamB, inner membrane protein subunit of TAM complex
MRAIRRLLQIVALVGTLLVGVVALALIISQTPWFKDWLRRYIVRESKQYLNGDLSIGQLGGNLFFGVQLADMAVDVSGERVVSVKGLEVDYSIFTLISEGVVLDRITLVEPALRLERDGEGWNVGGLVRKQRREAEREGPARPITLQSIEVSDGALDIVDRVSQDGGQNGGSAYELPARVENLDARASFGYAPVHYSVDIENLSFTSRSPDLTLQQLAGKLSVRDDNLYLQNLVVSTPGSSITVDGVVEQYLRTRVVKLTTTGHVSLPEIGRVVPAVSGYALHPAFDIKANGPGGALTLDLDVRSEAGNIQGVMTADLTAPRLGVAGDVRVEVLNLAPLLKDPAQRSDITGLAKIDLVVATEPARAPVLDRMSGTFRFDGPRVVAAGYQATEVRATGGFENGRIRLDARATAYGGSATASGFIAPSVLRQGSRGQAGRRPLELDLQGRAEGVNLKGLPTSTRVPALDTNLSVAEYHVQGKGGTIRAFARLNQSEVEGATIADGTIVEFGSAGGRVTYAGRGGVENLNLQRLGRALEIAALDKPEYDGQIAGTFDVRGAGTKLDTMTLDASGVLTDASVMGARVADLTFDAHLADAGLDVTVKGAFEDLDPARVANKPRLAGNAGGTVDGFLRIADLTEPITPDSITVKGLLNLQQSTIGGLRIDGADIQGQYANRIGDIARVDLKGPDLNVTTTGRFSLDRATQSSLTYHVEASDLAEVGRLAGQEGLGGSVILDGTLTGNAGSMQTTGTLDGSDLSYLENNALDLNAKYSVTVPELSFGDATVRATTTANFVRAGGIRLNSVEATTTYAKKTLEFSASLQEQTREVDASGQVIFHPDHQEIHLPQLAIRTEGLEWRSAPGVEAAVQYGGGKLSMQNVRLVNADQTLGLDGTLALQGEENAGTLDVTAGNVDVAQLEKLLLQNRGLSGRLNARAAITGTAGRPIVDGHAEIANGGFQAFKYELLTADVDYHGDRIDLDARLQQSATETITARGTVPMSLFSRSQSGHVESPGEDRVDVHIVSTDLGLGLVQGFTDVVTNVTGTLQADVRLTGSGQDPHLEGTIDIKNGAFGVPLGGVSYTGLHTRIDLKPDLITIQKFQLTDEHGEPLTISGQLAVHARQVGAVDIILQSDNFEVIDNSLGDVGLDTELKITGELRRPRVEGQVRIEAGRIEVDQVLQMFHDPYSVASVPQVVSAERSVEGSGSASDATKQALLRAQGLAAPREAAAPEPEAGAGEPQGLFAPLAMDVRLVIPDNLVLRGKNLRPGGPTRAAIGDVNVTVGGNLQIRKAPDGPVTVSGIVNTVRGTYEFQGRRFDLARDGTIRFTGDPKINPLLNVSATRMIPNTGVEARIQVTGTVDAPELKLSSDPPLEESDVLAMIVFNRPINELGTGERASLAATAGGIATGFLAAPLGESIGRALDVDIFEITTITEDGELGAGLVIGQQIGDRAFLKLRQQFGEDNISEFLIEYQIADFLRVRGSGAPETSGSANRIGQRRVERAGIDLIFFFSY